MEIKIFGSGCKNCKALYENAAKACENLNLDVKLTKVEDIFEISRYNILSTPAIAIDDVVVMQGSVLNTEQIAELIGKFAQPKKKCCCCCSN